MIAVSLSFMQMKVIESARCHPNDVYKYLYLKEYGNKRGGSTKLAFRARIQFSFSFICGKKYFKLLYLFLI